VSHCQTVSTCERTDCSEQGHTCQPLQHAGLTCSLMQTKAQHTPTRTAFQRLQKKHMITHTKLPSPQLKLKSTECQLSKERLTDFSILTSLHHLVNYHVSVNIPFSFHMQFTHRKSRQFKFYLQACLINS